MKKNLTLEHKKEIQSWLDSKDQDFDIGFNLFVRFSHNRSLALFLQRKRKHSKLVYEMQKIVQRQSIIEAPVMPIKPIKNAVAKADPKKLENIDISKDPGQRVEALGRLRVLVDEKINYDDLPEDMKTLYDETRDRYKRMRAVHEQMKIAKTDDARHQARKSLVYLDDKITEGWKLLDNWFANQKLNNQAKASAGESAKKQDEALKITQEINAARAYISRNTKSALNLKGVNLEKRKDQLKARIDILKKHDVKIEKAETLEALRKLGILTDWREAQ